MALASRVGGLAATVVAARSFNTSESAWGKKGGIEVRVVSYNVLSDSLCDKDHFYKCLPADCDNTLRLERVKRRLKEQMDRGAVICLQEVSRKWGAELIPLVEANNYNHASALYGNPFNGYMGQAILWPKSKYAIQEVDLSRIGDTKAFPAPRSERKEKKGEKGGPAEEGIVDKVLIAIGIRQPEKKSSRKETEELNVWKETTRRSNCVVMVRLKHKTSGASFVVADYHMPCLFGSDRKCAVMVAHSALLFQHAQKWAGSDPLMIVGDFNTKPKDPCYSLMATGALDPLHPQHPPSPAPFDDPFDHNQWKAAMKPMRSAYAEKNGAEPEFTNYAQTKFGGDEVFCETLDYIWLSSEWGIKSVCEVPSKASLKAAGTKSFPTASEPSDHILIGADLQLAK